MRDRRLRILNYAWHTGHQYELHRLPHDFTLATEPGAAPWRFDQRPLRRNVRCAPFEAIDPRRYDLAILHFDEEVFASEHHVNAGLRHPFLRALEEWPIPKIAICHGTLPFLEARDPAHRGKVTIDEAQHARILAAVGELPIVCNSHAALAEWRFANARVIWHGFDPDEYTPRPTRDHEILTVLSAMFRRPTYQGYHVYREATSGLPADYLGWDEADELRPAARVEPAGHHTRRLRHWTRRIAKRPAWLNQLALRDTVCNRYALRCFEAYRATVGRYRVYFNPTLRSPMPRTRGEAMMLGLAVVTTDYHDEERFVADGVSGFRAREPAELGEKLRWLVANPDAAARMGAAAREVAMRDFHVRRYLDDWSRLLTETLRDA